MFGNNIISDHICGCHYVSRGRWCYLPQVQLHSHTFINPVCFTTQLSQVFHNSNHDTLEQVRYTFPLYDGVAVNGYTISYGEKVLKGVVVQKDEARHTYEAAVDRGETAGLLETLPAGVFGVTLGNVPAKTDIKVDITYCGELKHDAQIDGLRYILPTTIAPRYGSYPGEVLQSNSIPKGGISITVDIDAGTSAIRRVQSPSHPIAVSMGATSSQITGTSQTPFKPNQASATLSLGTAELAADFVLQLLIEDISVPQAIIEQHPTIGHQRAVMATLVPKFTLPPAHPEIVFIVDQSDSMSGAKNAALVRAMKVFLKSLPLGVRFNICAFGSHYKFLWPQSQAYSEANLNKAMEYVSSLTASYGGTEILQPIRAAFEQRLQDLPLELMLLTDGEVWAEHELFNLVNSQVRGKDNRLDARVFALGIGSDVSHTLVEGVARAGNGFAQFATQDEETDTKVVRMLKGALFAHTWDYQIEVHYGEEGEGDRKEEVTEDDGFDMVEEVQDCLNIGDQPPAYKNNTPVLTEEKKEAKSFFDTSVDIEKPTTETAREGADRYAHLPSIETPKLLQAPWTIPPLFPFNRTTLCLLLGPEAPQKAVTSLTIHAKSAEGPLELKIPVHPAPQIGDKSSITAPVHQLAARKALQDLEEGRGWLQSATTRNGNTCDAQVTIKEKHPSRFDEIVEREIVRLSEKFQVASKFTSVVAVDTESGQKEKMVGSTLDIQRRARLSRAQGYRSGGAVPVMASSQSAVRRSASPSFSSFWNSGSRVHGLRIQCSQDSSGARSFPHGAGGLFGSSNLTGSNSRGGLFGGGGLVNSHSSTSFGMSSRGRSGAGASGGHRALTGASLSSMPPPAPRVCDVMDSDEEMEEADSYQAIAKHLQHTKQADMAPADQLPGLESLDQFEPAFETTPSMVNDKVSQMHALISLQSFSGAWHWSKQLSAILGPSGPAVEMIGVTDDLDDARATAGAIAWLQTHAPEEKDIWEMVVAKAKAWLAHKVGEDEQGVDEVIKKAEQLV